MLSRQTIKTCWLPSLIILVLIAACTNNNPETDPPDPQPTATHVAEAQPTQTEPTEIKTYPFTPEACSFFTEEDINALFQSETSGLGDIDSDGYFTTCTWQDNNGGASITLNIWGNAIGVPEWTSIFLNDQIVVGEVEPLAMLGEEAFYAEAPNFSGVYWREADEFVVIVSTTFFKIEKDELLSLAQQIDDDLAVKVDMAE